MTVDTDHITLDIAGIGMRIYMPATNIVKLSPTGSKVMLFTSFIVREFSQTLYGFLEKQERDLFEKVITINGVGPKLALGLLGAFDLHELAEIIVLQDAKALARAPGVGKKTAERLLVELKEISFIHTAPSIAKSSHAEDALQALINLGYTRQQAQGALKKSLDEEPSQDLSKLLASSLQHL